MSQLRLTRRTALGGAAAFAVGAPTLAQTKPEVGTVVIAPQFGLAYLPLHVMKNLNLVESHLAKGGLPNSKVEWVQTTGGAVANDALLSGNIHVVSGGMGPLLTIWDRTRANLGVRGLGTFDATALYLNTNRAEVKTIADFNDKDRIAMPAVKVSIQAVTLHMAAEQAFGPGQHARLDHLTVSMSHPDATAALLSGRSEVTGHFTSPPFQWQQLKDQRIKRVLSSFEVLGGPVTFNSAYTTSRFRDDNPRSYKSVFDALKEAHEFIQKNRAESIRIYIEEEKSRLAPAFIAEMLDSPDLRHTIVPLNTIKYAHFMHKTGALRTRAESWKDYYFADVHEFAGS